MAGLAAARARGRSGGRRSKLGVDQRRTARTLYDERQLTVAQIGQVLGVSRTSIYRALGQDTAAASGAARPACCPRSPPRGAEHDFWAPYWHFDVTHAVCGAHLGRELAAAANVDGQADWAGGLDRLLLVEINRTVTAARATGADELAPELLATYRCRYGDRDSAVVGGRSEGTRIGSSAASTREAPRGVSWRWVSLRPGRMAIVDRTNPWPAVVALAGLLVAGCSAASGAAGRLHPGPAASAAAVASSPAAPVAQGRPTSPTPTPNGRVSSDRRLVLERTITGAISSKSVVATGTGLVFAQNMMYQHTITVYRADGTLAATIPDSVDLAAYRIAGHPGQVRGAPVEAASSPDHKSMYVSNYSMYGAGFGPEGSDACTSGDGIDPSTLYRIDTTRLAVDGVVQVGAVPKYVAVTPDGRFVLVSNWCSGTLSVVDRTSLTEVRQVRLGRYPRGIAVDPHSRTAYVAVMGSSDVAQVDLSTFAVSWLRGIGSGPRHLVLDSTGRFLYVTLNGDGRVAKVDTDSGRVVARVATGRAPRSMTIAADGRSLYVVNYESDTVTKLRADDLTVLQSVPTNASPIGITYEPTRDQLWIACYTGSIQIFSDT